MSVAPRPRRRRVAASDDLRVFVRLYRGLLPGASYKGLLGDCYLLRLVQGTVQSTILIDCGMLLGSPDASARMAAIADDILKETGGTLDLLVVTHEHWDHISGFDQAREVFLGDPATGAAPKLKIAELWMAWTEDPADATASQLRPRFDKSGTALAALAERMAADKASGAGSPFAAAPMAAIEGLENFLGPLMADNAGVAAGGVPLAAAATKQLTGRAIFDALKKASGAISYLSPGTVLATPTAAALRTYVFGPPRDLARLFKDLPKKGEDSLYLDTTSFNAQLLIDAASDGADLSSHAPFPRRYRGIAAEAVKAAGDDDPALAWLRQRYFDAHPPCRFGAAPPPGHDCAKDFACGGDQASRRIDGDWLAAAGPLALKLDSDTNNTSLVLAFELPDTSVMLFAADAQVGNWESWHDQDYPAGSKRVTAAELLGRVRFYKVGHHGSHNATLTDQGLELMTRPDLVAAISTDYDLGAKQGRKGWTMPNDSVKAALLKRTKGRLIRGDRNHDSDNDLTPFAADADFRARLVETPLYIEYQAYGPVTGG